MQRVRRRSAPFVLGALGCAGVAANALRPFRGPGLGRQLLSFAAGLPVSELPRPALAAQGVVAVATGRGADRSSAAFRVGVGLHAAAAALLAVADRNARSAGPAYAEALRDALGTGAPAAEPPREPRRSGVVRTLLARRRYVRTPSAPYGPAGPKNLVDVWRRPDLPASGSAPVLLWIHGGGWIFGSRRMQAYPMLSHLAERGWVCVSASYRLSPRATWPDQIVDVKAAIAWVRSTIAEHGGDPDFLAIAGGSAGGHLATLAALTPGDPALQPGFVDADTSVDALVSLYGVYDWTNADGGYRVIQPFLERRIAKRSLAADRETFVAASPTSRVVAGAPPALVVHGTRDNLIPVEDVRVFVRRLRATSRSPVAAVELPGAHHGFDALASERSRATANAVERFLDAVRHGERPGGSVGR